MNYRIKTVNQLFLELKWLGFSPEIFFNVLSLIDINR